VTRAPSPAAGSGASAIDRPPTAHGDDGSPASGTAMAIAGDSAPHGDDGSPAIGAEPVATGTGGAA